MNENFVAHFEQGRALRRSGRLAEAVAAYDAALALWPTSVDALFNRGNALQALQRHADAVASYDRLLRIAPGDAEALNNRGVSLAALGRHAEALAAYEGALAATPQYAEALANRGNALAALGRLDEGLASIDRSLALRPDQAAAHSSRGRLLERAQRYEEALASFDAALGLRPADVESLCDRANALHALGRHAEALAGFDAAMHVSPQSVEALTNRGNVLQALGRHDDALASYAQALALKPGDPEVSWNEGLARLALGDYARGWPLYELRWQVPSLQLPPRDSDKPQWGGGEAIAGRRLLLHAEQGFGDAIQFVRYAHEVAGRGAEVTVACAAPLQRLFTRAHGVAQVVVPDHEPLPDYDLHAPLMSLPLAFATTLETIPRAVCLTAVPQHVERWQRRLAGARPSVGLAWSGNPDFPAARLKACPPALLARLVQSSGCRFASLQLGAARADVAELGEGVLDAAGELADFADTAALVAALDLVITIDTAVAHLAGALGKTVWILLPYAADWRWLVGRETSPWYPSARLYRQRAPGDWHGVIDRVLRDLVQFAGARAWHPSTPGTHSLNQP